MWLNANRMQALLALVDDLLFFSIKTPLPISSYENRESCVYPTGRFRAVSTSLGQWIENVPVGRFFGVVRLTMLSIHALLGVSARQVIGA